MTGLFAELRRRSVFRVAGVYVVVAWLIAQIAVVLEASLELPRWFDAAIVVVLILGFPVAMVLAWAFEVSPEGFRRAAPAAGNARPGRPASPVDLAILAALVGVLGFIAYDALRDPAAPEPEIAGSAAANVAERAPDDDRPSIAVLPFADMSQHGDQAYFSDGLSEELLNQLAQIPELRVTARTSSFVFRGDDVDAVTIGQTLRVAHLLEGSVRKDGDDLRVTAQLIDASDGSHVWSETYDRELDGIFALQEEIAGAVAERLAGTLNLAFVRPRDPVLVAEGDASGDVVRERLPAPTGSTLTYAPANLGGTDSFEAYDHYLRGRALAAPGGLDALEASLVEFQSALEIDPDFVNPHLEIVAMASNLTALDPSRAEEWLALFNTSIARAVAIAPDMPDVRILQAWSFYQRSEWTPSWRSFQAALSQRPGTSSRPATSDWVFSLYLHYGHAQEAAALALDVRARDPLSVLNSGFVAWAFDMAGDREAALAEFARSESLPGGANGAWQQFLRLMSDGDEEAVDAYLAKYPPNVDDPTGTGRVLERVLAVRDSPSDALAVLRTILDDGVIVGSNRVSAFAPLADYYGDTSLAVALLREGYFERGDWGLLNIWGPRLAATRRTEGFKQFARDLGLAAFWRETGAWNDFCRPLGEDDFECF